MGRIEQIKLIFWIDTDPRIYFLQNPKRSEIQGNLFQNLFLTELVAMPTKISQNILHLTIASTVCIN